MTEVNVDVFGETADEQDQTEEAPQVQVAVDMTAKQAIEIIEEFSGSEEELKAFIVGETRLTVLKAARAVLGDDTPAVDVPSGEVDPMAIRYLIEIDEQENQSNSCEVGVNGKVYQIKRGEPVEVNAEVMEVLKNAVAERIVQNDTGHGVVSRRQKYSAIPYRVLKEIHP